MEYIGWIVGGLFIVALIYGIVAPGNKNSGKDKDGSSKSSKSDGGGE